MCMNSFLGFGSQYVDRHHARSGQRAYLHIIRTRKAKVDTLFYFTMICFTTPMCTYLHVYWLSINLSLKQRYICNSEVQEQQIAAVRSLPVSHHSLISIILITERR